MARPANMNHTPAPDRPQHDPNVNQVEEMETQEGMLLIPILWKSKSSFFIIFQPSNASLQL